MTAVLQTDNHCDGSCSLGSEHFEFVRTIALTDAQAVRKRLLVGRVVAPTTRLNSWHAVVAQHLGEPLNARFWDILRHLITDQPVETTANLVTDQPRPLSVTQRQMVDLCDVPRTMADLMEEIGVTHQAFNCITYLIPIVYGGFLNLAHIDQPNHPKHSRVLSEIGVELKSRRLESKNAGESEDQR